MILAENSTAGNNLRRLNTVVDSLDVRLSRPAYPAAWLTEAVQLWREVRERWHTEPDLEPPLVELPNLGTFRVMPDRRPYEFVLINPQICDIRVWNPGTWSKAVVGKTGQLYVSFRSSFLQEFGTAYAVEYIERIAECFMGEAMPLELAELCPEFARVSRIDLAVDVQVERSFKWADLDAFVCQARTRDGFTTPYSGNLLDTAKRLHERLASLPPTMDNKGGALCMRPSVVAQKAFGEFAGHVIREMNTSGYGSVARVVAGRQPQTIYFGKLDGKLYGRLYNKLLSLPIQDKLYMLDYWQANGYDGASGVWRMEFSLSGDALRELGLVKAHTGRAGGESRELLDCLNNLPAIWRYLVTTWLRHTVPGSDKTVSRWENSSFWDVVAGAWGERLEEAERAPVEKNPDPEQLYKQALGVIGSYCAKLASGDFAPDALDGFIHDLLVWRETPEFYEQQWTKRRVFGCDDMSDAALSSRYRAERMLSGQGS